MTRKQRENRKFSRVFNEPLSDREHPLEDYNPPEKHKKESWSDYYDRVAEYDRKYKERVKSSK